MPLAAGSVSPPQLDGVVAAQSSICLLSAEDNRLAYRGYDVVELAERGSFEETAYLLLAGRLPRRDELNAFGTSLRGAAEAAAPGPEAAARRAPLRRPDGVAPDRGERARASSRPVPTMCPEFHRPRSISRPRCRRSWRPSIAARRGEKPVTPRRGLASAANFLYMLRGEEPERDLARAFDVGLSLRADNELNPSTFAARVAAATRADVHGCITAALAALAGPLHGGHALAVYRLLEEIGTPDRLAQVVDARIAGGKSFPGFGHPVYRGEDPRTAAMRRAASRRGRRGGGGSARERGRTLVPGSTLAQAVKTRARAATGKFANVDFYLAPLYRAAGIPPELFTPVFAVARVPGWLAHVLEQQAQEGLIRPRAAYVGAAATGVRFDSSPVVPSPSSR